MELETRMALIEQSYQNLEKRLDKVENKLDEIKIDMAAGQAGLTKVIIGAAGTITAGLLSTIVVVLMQLS
jgi:tetrahydromethanopterin S-methyltransferase subunit G